MSISHFHPGHGRAAGGSVAAGARVVSSVADYHQSSGRSLPRRAFLRAAAGATGALLTAGAWLPALAHARPIAATGRTPRPIPGGIQPLGPGTTLFHLYDPLPGNELSLITDFNGSIGAAHLEGLGIGTDTSGRQAVSRTLTWDADVRFMSGKFVDMDGAQHVGNFAFV